jgi:ubiquinone/menaquinone biosynthesis C-methylase UbiE
MAAAVLRRDVWRYHPATQSEAARRVTSALLDVCQIEPRERVLDIACGGGNPSVHIAAQLEPDGTVFAVDYDAMALRMIPAVTDAAGQRNLFICRARAEQLPFPDAAFGAATCRFGIMFFLSVDRVLAELRRVMRPGARVGFAVFSQRADNLLYCAIEGAFAEAGIDASACGEQVFRFAATGELEAVLRDGGLEPVETREVGVGFGSRTPVTLLRHILCTTYAAALASLNDRGRTAFVRTLQRHLDQSMEFEAEMARYRVVGAQVIR